MEGANIKKKKELYKITKIQLIKHKIEKKEKVHLNAFFKYT